MGDWDNFKVDPAPAPAPSPDAWAKFKPDPVMSSPQDIVGKTTSRIADSAQSHLENMGVSSDWAEGVGRLIDKAGPHSILEAVMQGMAVVPGLGEAMPEAAEAMPYLGKAISILKAPGAKGVATRAMLTGGVGAGVGAATGEGAGQGFAQGAGQSVLGDALSTLGAHVSGQRAEQARQVSALANNQADAAARQAVERRLGMTTGQAQELVAPPVGVSQASTQLAMGKRGIKDARQAARKAMQALYDPILDPINDLPVADHHMTKIADKATEQLATLHGQGQREYELTKPTRDLLHEFEGYHPDAIGGGSTHEASVTSNQIEMPDGTYIDAPAKPTTTAPELGNTASKLAGRTFLDAPEGGQPILTIKELRGRLQQLDRAAVRGGITNTERSALVKASVPIREAIEDALPDEMKPQLRAVNDAYAQMSNAFPFEDYKSLRKAATFPELGKAITDMKPAATSMVMPHVDPQSKGLMQQAVGSYILSDSTSGKELFGNLKKLQDSGTLGRLGFTEDFQKVGAWRDLVTQVRNIRDKPPDLMQAKQFMSGVRESLQKQGLTPELMDEIEDKMTKPGADRQDMGYNVMLRQLKYWGPLGLMMGYGWMARRPEMAIPIVAYLAGRKMIRNAAWRGFVMNGWTRTGGDMFARLVGAELLPIAQRLYADRRKNPDKDVNP